MEFVSATRVRPEHVDDLGLLNHVFALQLLEYARDDWYAEAGLWDGRPWSGDENLATLVLNVNFNYRLECFLDEELKIKTSPLARGTKSFSLAQEIIKPDGRVAIDGWTRDSGVRALDLALRFEDCGAAAILYTDINRDGAMSGVNVDATVDLAFAVTTPVIASGGVSSLRDLRELKEHEKAGIDGAIIGRALYDGRIDPVAALEAAAG